MDTQCDVINSNLFLLTPDCLPALLKIMVDAKIQSECLGCCPINYYRKQQHKIEYIESQCQLLIGQTLSTTNKNISLSEVDCAARSVQQCSVSHSQCSWCFLDISITDLCTKFIYKSASTIRLEAATKQLGVNYRNRQDSKRLHRRASIITTLLICYVTLSHLLLRL